MGSSQLDIYKVRIVTGAMKGRYLFPKYDIRTFPHQNFKSMNVRLHVFKINARKCYVLHGNEARFHVSLHVRLSDCLQ